MNHLLFEIINNDLICLQHINKQENPPLNVSCVKIVQESITLTFYHISYKVVFPCNIDR